MNVKSLLFATSALLSGIAAAPFPASNAKARTIDTSAVASRDLNAPHGLERRTLSGSETTTPNDIRENQWIYGSTVKSKDPNSISVTDLSGCTVLVFWDPDWNPSAFRLLCGQEEKDGEKAYANFYDQYKKLDANGVSIVTSNQTYMDNTVKGLKKYNEGVNIINRQFYKWAQYSVTTERFTFRTSRGSNVLQESHAPGTSNQLGRK